MRLNRYRLDGVLLSLAVLAGGCGYHFGAEGTALPPSAKTIYVQTFSNHSRFTGLNDEMMRYIKDDIADRDRLTVVDSPDDADLLLSGEVFRADSIPGNTNAVGEPLFFTDSISLQAKLVDRKSHQVLWSGTVNSDAQVPIVSSAVITTSPLFLQQNLRSQDTANLPDIQLAQTQRVAGQQQMMQQAAQNLYSAMAEGF
jgi:hypothetical protein